MNDPTGGRLPQARVLVVGDAMLDRYWHGTVERISPEAPVPVVRVDREEERIGGAGNVAYNVASLGAQASFVGVVGDDEAGRRIATLLAGCGVSAHLRRDAELKTTVKLRVIGRQQQLLRLDFESEPHHELLAQQHKTFTELLPAHDVVLFSDYGKGGLAHIPAMIASARAAGRAVLVDPKGRDWQRYAGASIITPNRVELREVIGPWASEDHLRDRVQTLRRQLDLTALLLTRSEDGMTLYDDQGEQHVPAQAREVFDVTGAGDTVIAVQAALMAAGLTPRQAMVHANRAAGIVVGRFGTAAVSAAELFG